MAITRSDTLLTADLIAEYEAAGYWVDPTFPELLQRNARECGDRVAFIEGDARVTWSEVWGRCRRLAGHLLTLGVGKGDVVGIQLPNSLEFIYALGAVNTIGAVACPHLATLRRSELRFVLGFSEAVVTIVPESDGKGFSYCDLLNDLWPELPNLRKVLVVGAGKGLAENCVSMERLLSTDADLPDLDRRLGELAPSRHDVNRLLFTSGSTGDPKGVLHTYATTTFSNVQTNRDYKVDENSVLLLFVPITLNWGMFHVIQSALARCKLILFRDFSVAQVLSAVERERVTHLGGPPTALVALQRDGTYTDYDLSSVLAYTTSGASCPIELLQQCRRELSWPIIEGYGMTECGWIAANSIDDTPEETVGTVGRPFPGIEIRLENIAGVGDGGEGDSARSDMLEVTMRGPNVCVGYFRNPQRNAASWNQGFFRTGDIGYFDEAGRLRIAGRTKDLIIHGGANIIPRDIEELIFEHPKVADVAVIGVPDSYFGENVCVCVIPKAGKNLDMEEINSFLSGKIAKYKLPQQIELFEIFPYTQNGKVQKNVLQKEVRDRISGKLDCVSHNA